MLRNKKTGRFSFIISITNRHPPHFFCEYWNERAAYINKLYKGTWIFLLFLYILINTNIEIKLFENLRLSLGFVLFFFFLILFVNRANVAYAWKNVGAGVTDNKRGYQFKWDNFFFIKVWKKLQGRVMAEWRMCGFFLSLMIIKNTTESVEISLLSDLFYSQLLQMANEADKYRRKEWEVSYMYLDEVNFFNSSLN